MIAQARGYRDLTVECSVYDDHSTQLITEWNFAPPGGSCLYGVELFTSIVTVSFGNTPYKDRLVIGEFIDDLDNLTVLCGAGSELFAGRFLLRIYRKNFISRPPLVKC